MNTPATLVRLALYWLLGQTLVIVAVAAAVPGGSSWLTLAGFVTPHYDENLFAVRLVGVPWTDPAVFFSLQTFCQMLGIALIAAGAITLVKTNPWQHGVLPDSAPPGRDKSSAPASSGPAPAPAATPARTPAPQSPTPAGAPAPAPDPDVPLTDATPPPTRGTPGPAGVS